MNYGKIAYEAYCKASGNKSLISGAELPSWDKLDPKIQEAWTAAGLAVFKAGVNQCAPKEEIPLTEAARCGFEGIQHPKVICGKTDTGTGRGYI